MSVQPLMTTSWNGGELSPLMHARVDTSIYAIGAAVIENMVPTIEGPLTKCPGFERIRAADPSATRMIDFIFSATQAYALECGESRIRLYTNGARIEDGSGNPIEVTVPYTAAEWPQVWTQQSYDRLYMAHPDHPPAVLTRTGATSFTYDVLELEMGPLRDGNKDRSLTVTLAGPPDVGATVTITASGAIFQPGHVDGLFQYEARDFGDVRAWEVGIDGNTAHSTRRWSDGKMYLARSNGTTGSIQPTHDEGQEWDGSGNNDVNGKGPYGVLWEYIHDRFGLIRITNVVSSTVAEGEVVRRIPDTSTAPTWRWAHGAFSTAEGWPNLVFVWNQRLCFWKGFDLYASVVGDYRNFQAFSSSGYLADDLAFRLRLAAPNPPLWVAVDRTMIVGTSSGEYVVGAANANAPVTGGNISASKQSKYGVAPVPPVEPGTSVVFVQRSGRQLREAAYEFSADRYLSSNINRFARHIAGPGFVELGHQASPEELLFAVRTDGALVFRSYDPEQEVKGFARRRLAGDGRVLSAVSIPSEDGSVDEIWALCQWGAEKSVQRMARWFPFDGDQADAFFVDDGLSDTLSSPSDQISGLGHLVGVEVAILADGAVMPRQVVPPGGTITIDREATKRTVGRPYRSRVRTLKPAVPAPNGGSGWSKIKRLVDIALSLLATGGSLKISAGRDERELIDRPVRAAMDAAVPLKSFDTDPKAIEGEWGRSGQYELYHDLPTPAFVIAAMPQVEVATR